MDGFINFPKDEYKQYLERLNNNLVIYTTRVSVEVGKYKLGEVYSSVFGDLKVISLKHYSSIEDHPFYAELNENQINEISEYINESGYEVVGLIKISKQI